LILKTYPANLIEPYAIEIKQKLQRITLPAMKEDRNATIALLTKVFSSPAVRPDEEPFDIDLLAEKASSGNQSLRFDAF